MLPHNLLMNCLKNVSNLSVLSPFLFSCKNIFFSVRGGGGGGRLTSGTYFLICSYFFLKMPFYPSFFTLKCHLLVKIRIFSCWLRSLGFNKLTKDLFQRARCKTSFFLDLTPKGSLFSLYYFHSYHPAH